jgi:hypothetical protein
MSVNLLRSAHLAASKSGTEVQKSAACFARITNRLTRRQMFDG